MSTNQDYQIIKQGPEDIMRIPAESWPYAPSLENNPLVMASTIDKLVEVPSVSSITFSQHKKYHYDYHQTQMLIEIANIYKTLVRQRRILSLSSLAYVDSAQYYLPTWRTQIQELVITQLRSDPIGAYTTLKRLMREEKIKSEKAPEELQDAYKGYLEILNYVHGLLEGTQIIKIIKNDLAGHQVGSRALYGLLFKPTITPDFLFTQLMIQQPLEGIEKEVYSVGQADVVMYDNPHDVKHLYHLTPPEFKLTEDKYELLEQARTVLAQHQPREEEFLEPDKMRRTFYNIGRDLLQELGDNKGLELSDEELHELAMILVRYTVGFGLVEVLLQDQKIQDISINSPPGQSPIFIVHEDFDDCVTNIIPSREDVDSWATKFRILSGRPLDEANPILDTELSIPGARARVGIIQKPLNPHGTAYSFRRHRDKPWTLPLFIHNKMLNPLGAGLLSFLTDGSRTLLYAGTRSSGKTSLLGSTLVEIMRRYRIITVEDSVTGDSELIIKRNGQFERTTLGTLIDTLLEKHGNWYSLNSGHEVIGNPENIQVFAMDKKGKICLTKVSKFIRHEVEKPIYKVTTRTGRTISATSDHSLFTLSGTEIKEIKTDQLTIGSYLATARKLPLNNAPKKSFNILSTTITKGYIVSEDIKTLSSSIKEKIHKIAKARGYSKSVSSRWLRLGILPASVVKDLGIVRLSGFYKTSNDAGKIPLTITYDKELLTFIGLWLADGCYDKRSVIVSGYSQEERTLVKSIAKKFGANVKLHSDKFSLMINSAALKIVMQEALELKGDAYTKRIPSWVFTLSPKQIGYVLNGLFTGDGCPSDKEIVIPLASRELLQDVQTLLLTFGITFRIGKMRKDKTYNASISTVKDWKLFAKYVNFISLQKREKLKTLCKKKSTHTSTDVIPFSHNIKLGLFKQSSSDYRTERHDYLIRNNNIGRDKLQHMIPHLGLQQQALLEQVTDLTISDIYWDQVVSIEQVHDQKVVYDISVPGCESFVTNNLIAHNTLELPTDALRTMGYNIQPMKVRSALTKGGTEVPADEGIRTSLRLGDSALIVGEIRSTEAFALYEAMRVGALANVVAGTIHGDSPYGVFDRVVNDLKVPATSFKATDVIIVANPLRSPDGLHRWRRVIQITEVRKHWKDDPLREQGFVDLLKYNSRTDQLEPTPDLINGDSEIIKGIAGNVKEWASDWEAVWNNILLRAKTKEMVVAYSHKYNLPELLEAPFTLSSNDQFHKATEEVQRTEGYLNSKQIYFQWEEWLKRATKQIQQRSGSR